MDCRWLALVGLLGCDAGEKADTGTADTAAAEAEETDTGYWPGHHEAHPPNHYTSYEGWESFDHNDGTYPAGEFNCRLIWDLSGSAVAPMDTDDCPKCWFMFDVTYTLRDASTVYDDGTCEKLGLVGDRFGTYGYASSFDGYGGSWVFSYYGAYYWWGYGSFSGSDFTYYYGDKDSPYGSAWYTDHRYGSVKVQ